MKNSTSVVLLCLTLAVLVISPFVTIWSLNTLFGLGIEQNIFTWASVCWLTLFFAVKK